MRRAAPPPPSRPPAGGLAATRRRAARAARAPAGTGGSPPERIGEDAEKRTRSPDPGPSAPRRGRAAPPGARRHGLFLAGDFERAVGHFARGAADPRDVLALFPPELRVPGHTPSPAAAAAAAAAAAGGAAAVELKGHTLLRAQVGGAAAAAAW